MVSQENRILLTIRLGGDLYNHCCTYSDYRAVYKPGLAYILSQHVFHMLGICDEIVDH